MTAAYPVLSQLLGHYFNDGWDQRGGSTLAIERMIRETPRRTLHQACNELDALLASGVCEPQISDVLQFELGCHVTPADEGVDASTWLRRLRRMMSKAL
jgi:hypothetical protein